MAIGKPTPLSNRPFSNSRQPLFQGESACEVFVMKWNLPFEHPFDKTTPLLRPPLCASYKSPHILLHKKPVYPTTPLLRPTITFSGPQSFHEKILHITLYPIARGYSKQRNMKVPLTLAALYTLYVINKSGTKYFVLYLWSRIFSIRGLLPSVKATAPTTTSPQPGPSSFAAIKSRRTQANS